MMQVCDKCNQIKTKKLPPKPKKIPKTYYLELCLTCNKIETYRRDVAGLPLCVICESKKQMKKVEVVLK